MEVNWKRFNRLDAFTSRGGLIVGEERTLTEDDITDINIALSLMVTLAERVENIFDKARSQFENRA